mmetsp:Transcript_75085/g.199328  ORF Transcript_75085/g.199328 Transcript_75085/m.199328 type:complete len:331 (-) Transcript_75085:126-1118(-)
MLQWIIVCLTLPSRVQALMVNSQEAVKEPGDTLQAGGMLEMLWDGFDVPDDSNETYRSDVQRADLANSIGPSPIQLLGPPDSGTNLMVKMLQLNLPDRIPKGDGALDTIVWKHSLSSATDLHERFAKSLGDHLMNTTLIIMMRTPMAQLAAWRRLPYSLQPCFSRAVDSWSTPCFANTKPDFHDITPGVEINVQYPASNVFASSMDVYNQYVQQYLELEADNKFRNVIIVLVEDLVLSPKTVVSNIAHLLGANLPTDSVQVLGESAKGEMGHGRAEALRKLQSRSFLGELGAPMIPRLCEGIRREPISRFSEGTYTEHPRPYAQDCEAPA